MYYTGSSCSLAVSFNNNTISKIVYCAVHFFSTFFLHNINQHLNYKELHFFFPITLFLRHGYFPPSPQQGEAPMIGGGIIPGQRYPSHNNSPFSPPAFQQSPYQQSPGPSPYDSPNRGGGRGGYQQRRDSRGRGRGGNGGQGGIQFTPSGHQQFHNRKRFSVSWDWLVMLPFKENMKCVENL